MDVDEEETPLRLPFEWQARLLIFSLECGMPSESEEVAWLEGQLCSGLTTLSDEVLRMLPPNVFGTILARFKKTGERSADLNERIDS